MTVLKMLTKTRNNVTKRAILPGMISGGTTKLYFDLNLSVFRDHVEQNLSARTLRLKGETVHLNVNSFFYSG